MKDRSPLGRHAKAALSAVGIAAVLATGVAACGTSSSSSSGEKPKTLQMWVPPTMSDTGDSDVAVWKDLLKPWEQKNDVKVNVTIVSWASYEAKMLTGTSSGAGPDVTYMYNEMVGDYVKRGQLIALDKYLTTEDKANFLYLDKGKIAGKQYMMPYIVGGARVLFYNKDVLAKAGVTTPPATWSDFEQAAVKIKSAGYTPFLQQWGDPNRSIMNEIFYPFLWQAGGEIFNESGTATAFNSPAGVKAAQFLYSMKKDGLMPSSVTGLNEAQVRDQFTSGKVGFLMDSDATLPMFAKSKMNLGVIDSLQDQRQGTFLAVDSLVVPKQCPDPQLCMSLVKFIESGPVMTQIHTHAPFNPIAKDEQYAGQPQFASLYKNPAILHNLPVATHSVQAYNILYKNLQQMMLGQKSPEQALADAASEGDSALKQG